MKGESPLSAYLLTVVRFGVVLAFAATSAGWVEAPATAPKLNKEDEPMSSPGTQFEILSADLIPFVSDSAVSTSVSRVVSVQTRQRSGDPAADSGVVTLEMLKVLHQANWKFQPIIEVPFERIVDPAIRIRNAFNQWNNLTLDRGELLLVAFRPAATSKNCVALAAIKVASVNDPQVKAVETAYAIDAESSPAKKEQLIRQALTSDIPFLRFYTLNAIVSKRIVKRQSAAEMVGNAVAAPGLTAETRLDLASQLVTGGIFRETAGADDTNSKVLSVIAKEMVSAADREQAQQWAELLSSALGNEFSEQAGKDRKIRLALVRSVRDPAPDRVVSFLKAHMKAVSSDEREPLKDLLDLWTAATAD